MVNLRGTLFITDSKKMCYDWLQTQLVPNAVPIMVIDLDEQNTDMEKQFPHSVLKGTVLLPPPSVIFLQIDGDMNAFNNEYNAYLRSDVAMDFIHAMVYMLYSGINTIMYVDDFDENAIWLYILLCHFELDYGIHVGSSDKDPFVYNHIYDPHTAGILYNHCYIDFDEYVHITPLEYIQIDPLVKNRLITDASSRRLKGETYLDSYIRHKKMAYGIPIVPPKIDLVTFS